MNGQLRKFIDREKRPDLTILVTSSKDNEHPVRSSGQGLTLLGRRYQLIRNVRKLRLWNFEPPAYLTALPHLVMLNRLCPSTVTVSEFDQPLEDLRLLTRGLNLEETFLQSKRRG